MAQSLQEWVDTDVHPIRDTALRRLSEEHFFRDPLRPMFSADTHFFAPADGIVLYQQTVKPDEAIVDIKGKSYSLRDAMRDTAYNRESIVVGIFMTFFDIHVNRIPFPGRLSYRELEPLNTYNCPMLGVEKSLVRDLCLDMSSAGYLHNNQRMLNRVYAPGLRDYYYILQIADYDVNCIMPFQLKQNWPFMQNARFSQIRYGSQVDLIIPLSERFRFTPTLEAGVHVKAGVDPLITIEAKKPEDRVQKETPR